MLEQAKEPRWWSVVPVNGTDASTEKEVEPPSLQKRLPASTPSINVALDAVKLPYECVDKLDLEVPECLRPGNEVSLKNSSASCTPYKPHAKAANKLP